MVDEHDERHEYVHEPSPTANNKDIEQPPSNAWIVIIAVLMALIILFFALGGSKLIEGNTRMIVPSSNDVQSN